MTFETIMTNKEYLEREHIFVTVKEHSKKKEVNDIGQSSISLLDACGPSPVHFDCKLIYRGKHFGNLKGKIHVSWEKENESKSSYAIDAFTQIKGYLLKQKGRRKAWDRKWFVLASNCLYSYPSENVSIPFLTFLNSLSQLMNLFRIKK